MASSELKVEVSAEVEFSVGPATATWLKALGWTPPVAPVAGKDEAASARWQCRACGSWWPWETKVCTNAHIRKRGVREADVALATTRPEQAERARALTGFEAQMCAARKIRAKIVSELQDSEIVDELLRLCDVNMKALFAEDCDC